MVRRTYFAGWSGARNPVSLPADSEKSVTRSTEGEIYALDYRGAASHPLDAGNGEFLYAGGLHSHPARAGDRGGADSSDPGQKSCGLTSPAITMKKGDFK